MRGILLSMEKHTWMIDFPMFINKLEIHALFMIEEKRMTPFQCFSFCSFFQEKIQDDTILISIDNTIHTEYNRF